MKRDIENSIQALQSKLLGQFIFAIISAIFIFSSFASAFANPRRSENKQISELLNKHREDAKKEHNFVNDNGARSIAEQHDRTNLALSVSRIGKISFPDIRTTINRTNVKIKTTHGIVVVDFLATAAWIKNADDAIKKINRSDLEKEEQIYYDAILQATEIAAQFMALGNKTSVPILTRASTNTQLQWNAYFRQISLIQEILSGQLNLNQLKSHIEIMQSTIKIAKSKNRIHADFAFARAIEERFGNIYIARKKMEELLSCR